jgi:hypothetical protein
MSQSDDIRFLANCVREIARGDNNGPLGLEAIGMSLEGEGKPGHNNLADAIKSVAESNQNIADAILKLAASVDRASIRTR